MAAEPKQRGFVECRTPDGRLLATVEIVTLETANQESCAAHSLVLFSAEEAQRNGEEQLQLRERGRYEYLLRPAVGAPMDLALMSQRGVRPSLVRSDTEDRGLIEPQDHCGLFPLTIIRRSDPTQRPLARGSVEVRSLKLQYREHYRGMLSFIAEKCAGLLVDCRAPTQLRLSTLWRRNSRVVEQQLEFLRQALESTTFRTAVDEVLRNPHRRLESEREERDIYRPFKIGKDFARQIAVSARRIALPASNALYPTIQTVPTRVAVQSRADFLDTGENRFAKSVLTDFRDFLTEVTTYLSRRAQKGHRVETQRLLRDARKLCGMLELHLSRGFFPDVSPPSVFPMGSPVLQRKAGYRELLRLWLQFHAGAQLAWDGGSEVFEAGSRNVATLYEYWLFFQLEKIFRQRFACEQPLHSLVVDKDSAPPRLVLKRGIELSTPVAGVWSKTAGRHLKAEFHFNRKFTPRADRESTGSWTRGVQPDYTISIWPAELGGKDLTARRAEELELLVHVHFDAKYRVERVAEIMGDPSDDEAFKREVGSKDEARTAAKYADLLKMHAYRDAIRRTAGAYVLYPGEPGDGDKFQGFHEVLPGLGAFAIRPSQDGSPQGISALTDFLDKVIEHLANRTTARERVSYHVVESYTLRDPAVPYGALHLAEADIFRRDYRALPPAEDMVLVGWYENDSQVELARDEAGFTYFRLGRRRGAFHVHPNLARVRHVILRTHGGVVAPGLLNLREAGFQVFTRSQLRMELKEHAKGRGVEAWEASAKRDEEEYIYALFRTTADPLWVGQSWLGGALMEQIKRFESDARNTLVMNVRRTSADPRILSLKDVLKTRA